MTIRRLHKTYEEKVAEKISDLLADVRLNLDQVGIYLARNTNLGYNRLMLIAESAEWEKELENDRQQYTLF
jgi:hypothetical protein